MSAGGAVRFRGLPRHVKHHPTWCFTFLKRVLVSMTSRPQIISLLAVRGFFVCLGRFVQRKGLAGFNLEFSGFKAASHLRQKGGASDGIQPARIHAVNFQLLTLDASQVESRFSVAWRGDDGDASAHRRGFDALGEHFSAGVENDIGSAAVGDRFHGFRDLLF